MGYGVGIVLNADYSKCYKNIGVQVIYNPWSHCVCIVFHGLEFI